MMKEAKINPDKEGAEVPRALGVALTFTRAAEYAASELRRQHQLIQQLKGEHQHLRDINQSLASQLVAQNKDTAPNASGEPEVCSISIVTEGKVPPELKAMLEDLVNMINSIK